mgnify:CR=1 FL=1
MGLAVQTDMAMAPILAFGTGEQKQEWVAPAIAGTKILCLGITEPDAGSDVAGIKTRAVDEPATRSERGSGGTGWRLQGRVKGGLGVTKVNRWRPPSPIWGSSMAMSNRGSPRCSASFRVLLRRRSASCSASAADSRLSQR